MYKIESLNDQGKGVCFVDNKITFVDNALVGEEVELNITRKASKFNSAYVTKYIKTSDKRVNSFCEFSDICGGCALANMDYNDTLEFKKNKVNRILKKFANIDTNVDIISSNNLNYRNKITLQVKDKIVGYYKENTNDIVNISECKIANNNINKFIKYINDSEIINGQVVIRINYNDELLINFITEDPIITPEVTDLKIVGILKNGKVLKGDNKFIEIINNKLFQVSYDSFFQINREICSKLFNLVYDNIIPNSNVVDLYCGVGTLGINVSDKVNNVYGIEIIPNAIINAVTNAKMNKKDNCKYMLGDATKLLPKINDKIDSIICDPPRSGLTKEIINTIKELNVKQIIYISCDPITLARDINLLSDNYKINKITTLDMFPYTYHVESFCVLERNII